MIPRQAETIVRQRLAHTPAVVLLGPRQVGKTTLARQIAQDWPTGSIYLDLERLTDRNKTLPLRHGAQAISLHALTEKLRAG